MVKSTLGGLLFNSYLSILFRRKHFSTNLR
jgi:hypothetical protein